MPAPDKKQKKHRNSVVLPAIKSALAPDRSLEVLHEADETALTLKKRKRKIDVNISNTPMKKFGKVVIQELD